MFQLRLIPVVAQATGPGTQDGPGHRPIVVANPANDPDLRAIIDRFVIGGGGRPQDLEAVLRTRFPAAVVRRRELDGERFEVWYVYRDGHWIRSGADGGTR